MSSAIRKRVAFAAAGVAAALLFSACSTSGSGASGAGTQTIRLVANNPSAFLTDFYIAQEKGMLAKHHVKIDFVYSQNPEAVLVSGKADLVYQPVLASLLAISQGLALKAVSTVQVNTYPILLANKTVPSLADLQSMTSCRIATTASGNSAYGYATYWIKLLKLHCALAIAASGDVMVAGAVSGAYQAAVTPPQYGPQTAPQGTHVLVNPLNVASDGTVSVNRGYISKYALPNAITTALCGQSSYVSANSQAIKNLLAALDEAQTARKSMSSADIAKILAEANPGAFGPSTISSADLATSIEYGISSVVEQPITTNLWNSSLKSYSYYGSTAYKASNPAYAYDKVVVNI
jgi:ABC-type nitrate/sulfonate/bicarbonate transport system substrate-binding protein